MKLLVVIIAVVTGLCMAGIISFSDEVSLTDLILPILFVVACHVVSKLLTRTKPRVERRINNVYTSHTRRWDDVNSHYAKYGQDAWGHNPK